MELMPGYKRSDVGVIPDDWDVLPLGKLVRSVEYGSAAKSDVKGAVPVLRMGNLQGGKIDWSDLVYTDDIDEINKYTLQPGDVLFNRTNTIDLVGKTSIYEGGCPAIFAGYLIRINVVPDLLCSRFLNYILNTEFSRKYSAKVLSVAVGQANINGQKLKTYPIPLPPTKTEQEDIAQALSDVDELLVALDQIIAKKRDLKQAAMQQLLTGQTRLPGFCGEWKEKRLGELGEVTGAGVDKKIHPNETPVRLLNYMDVYRKNFLKADDFWHEVTAKPDQVKRCAVQRGDVFFTPTSEVRDDIGHSAVAIEDVPDVVYSYHVVRLRLSEAWDIRFRAYAFKTKRFLDQASTQCEGSGTRYVITLPKFRSITVQYPAEVAEQTAIAGVLSDMDAELTVLEARRDKTRNIKQAMMQELLTGKTRLV